jgi:Glycosyltransferase family 10 (fucosyltransferase) C-term
MLQSAPFDLSGRNNFARELMAHMKIDSYGRFLNNRQLETEDSGHATKIRLIAKYKFCLDFENAIASDYVTEKFFDPFISGTVPVYRGAPNVDLFAPGPNSFVDASKFSGPKELAEFLIHLDDNDDAYRRYFSWREAGLSASLEKLLSKCDGEAFCRLCKIVVESQATYRRPAWMRSISAPRIALGL